MRVVLCTLLRKFNAAVQQWGKAASWCERYKLLRELNAALSRCTLPAQPILNMFAFYFQSHLNHNCAGICCCGIRYAACWLGYNSKTQTMNVSSVHMRVAFAASTAFWSPSHYKGGYQVFYPLGFQTGCPQLTKSGLYQLGCAQMLVWSTWFLAQAGLVKLYILLRT